MFEFNGYLMQFVVIFFLITLIVIYFVVNIILTPINLNPSYFQSLIKYRSEFTPESYQNNNIDFSNTDIFSKGVFSPYSNHVYLIPYQGSILKYWQYINSDNQVISYESKITNIVEYAYSAGVSNPNSGFIYLIPYNQSNQSNWHYIDVKNNNKVVSYTAPNNVVFQAYNNGVYDYDQDRIYLVPNKQSTEPFWHYIDCKLHSVVSYPNPHIAVKDYVSGIYFSDLKKIYLIPSGQSDQNIWHYINCSNNTIVPYTQSLNINIENAFSGAVYSPINKIIYFIPLIYVNKLIYIQNDVLMSKPLSGIDPYDYDGASYVPIQNKIFFVPRNNNKLEYHYIDCDDELIKTYLHNFKNEVDGDSMYIGSTYNPINNSLYFIPDNYSTKKRWHLIKDNSNAKCNKFIINYL